MGCGSSKVFSETSKNGYVSFVKTCMGYNKRKGFDKPQKFNKKQKDVWGAENNECRKAKVNLQQPTTNDGQRQSKVAKYRVTFDPRVTARYDIKALIGRGSFSRVVRVEHRATRQPFAIKMAEVEAPEGRLACAAELAVLRRVRHANVVRLAEVFQTARRVYMVLELATGGQLLDRVVARGHFTERHATRALRMALDGAAYLHSLGIAHRDLKPENLLYYHPGAESRLLVTDFGLASGGGEDRSEGSGGGGDGVRRGGETTRHGDREEAERPGGGGETEGAEKERSGDGAEADWALMTARGTPEYMAPEGVLRRPCTCAVDMWALGVITYVLLSGTLPFEDDSQPRLYRAIVRGKYSFHGEPWPSVSNLAKDFIERLLVPDPASRLTGEQALRHPWMATRAAGSSAKNLHRSISQNLRRRASRASSHRPGTVASPGLDGGRAGPGGN